MTIANYQRFHYGNPGYVELHVAYNTEVSKGDMLKLAKGANLAVVCTGASDNDTFAGIADEPHVALSADDSKTHKIRALIPNPSCVFEYPLNAASDCKIGMGLAVSAVQILALASTDHIAIAIEYGSQLTTVKCIFLTPPMYGGVSQSASYDALSYSYGS